MEFQDSQRFLDRNARDHTINVDHHQVIKGHINQEGYANIAAKRKELADRAEFAAA